MPRDLDAWPRAILLVLGVALGIFLRVQGIADLPFFGDEYHTRDSVVESYGTILTTFDAVGSHVVLPLLQRISLDVFGDGVLAMRLPALIPAILTLLLMYPLVRPLIGATPACLATLALSFSPMHVYYSRFGRGYALMVLLGLVLGVAVVRALRGGGRRWWCAAGVCAVLLPYTQLSSAGFVAALGLVALHLARRDAGRRGMKAPLLAFGGAAVVLGLLFVPLLSQVRTFFTAMPEQEARPLGWFGIPTLLAGGRLPGLVWLAAFPGGLGLMAIDRSRRDVALVAAAAFLGPLAALLVTRPHGMDYAYARYLLNALPFVLMGMAWLLCTGLQKMISSEAVAGRAALAAGVFLIAGATLTGPLSAADGGSFGNTYLAMEPLPAFDARHPAPPPFYEQLAGDPDAVRIIEGQPLLSRAVLLYRAYERIHGKQVFVGWPGEIPRSLDGDPYAALLAGELDADYLVLHKDLRREVRDYWRFVYLEAWLDHARRGDDSFMERHKATMVRSQDIATPETGSLLATYLRRRLGEPFLEDEQLWVWKLR